MFIVEKTRQTAGVDIWRDLGGFPEPEPVESFETYLEAWEFVSRQDNMLFSYSIVWR